MTTTCYGREPERQRAGVVLDQDADEALHRADDRAVQHDRRVARVVLADVLGAEAPRHAEVDLHGAALPDAADAVLQRVLDLRAVERALARRRSRTARPSARSDCLQRRPRPGPSCSSEPMRFAGRVATL